MKNRRKILLAVPARIAPKRSSCVVGREEGW